MTSDEVVQCFNNALRGLAMFDFISANPFALGVLALPVMWACIIVHRYRAEIQFWWKLMMTSFPLVGLIARIKRRPDAVRILNRGAAAQICAGERSLAMSFVDELTPRLSAEGWRRASTFLILSGDSELPQLLRAPPTRALAKVTIIFIEAYTASLLLVPKLSGLVTPEQIPLMGFGISVALAIGLTALLTKGGRESRLVDAWESYMRSYARDPQSGDCEPKPIGWQDDQSVDEDRPSFQMSLARLKARGSRLWVIAAVLGAVLTVLAATGLRYSTYEEEAAREAVLAEQRQLVYEAQSSPELSSLQKIYVEVNRTATEFALAIFLLTFGLGTILTFMDAKDRNSLGRGVSQLLDHTRKCAAFEEEAALLRRNHATVNKLLSRLQREMPPFARATIPSIYDVMKYIAASEARASDSPDSFKAAEIDPQSPPAPVNVAQLPARREPLEKSA